MRLFFSPAIGLRKKTRHVNALTCAHRSRKPHARPARSKTHCHSGKCHPEVGRPKPTWRKSVSKRPYPTTTLLPNVFLHTASLRRRWRWWCPTPQTHWSSLQMPKRWDFIVHAEMIRQNNAARQCRVSLSAHINFSWCNSVRSKPPTCPSSNVR